MEKKVISINLEQKYLDFMDAKMYNRSELINWLIGEWGEFKKWSEENGK